MTAGLLIGLAAQYPPASDATTRSGARFFILDGCPEDHPHAGELARIAGHLPHGVEVGGWRDTARILSEVAEEVRRRQESGGDGPEVFVLIHDLARFRDLRRREDEFSFSKRDDEDAAPVDHLDTILREGSGLGVHVIAWCDTVNNLNRHFTHQVLREFEMRVLFQMSPADSGQMLDSPLASKLGPHRASSTARSRTGWRSSDRTGSPRTIGSSRSASRCVDEPAAGLNREMGDGPSRLSSPFPGLPL